MATDKHKHTHTHRHNHRHIYSHAHTHTHTHIRINTHVHIIIDTNVEARTLACLIICSLCLCAAISFFKRNGSTQGLQCLRTMRICSTQRFQLLVVLEIAAHRAARQGGRAEQLQTPSCTPLMNLILHCHFCHHFGATGDDCCLVSRLAREKRGEAPPMHILKVCTLTSSLR